jgi:ribosome assembly protein YihI (activator of Der GTPase)
MTWKVPDLSDDAGLDHLKTAEILDAKLDHRQTAEVLDAKLDHLKTAEGLDAKLERLKATLPTASEYADWSAAPAI